MADYLPKFKPGQAVTFTAATPLIGGHLVTVSGEYAVTHAAAASKHVAGVAAQDAKVGDHVAVYSGGVQRCVVAGTAIVAGDRVFLAADGCVAKAGSLAIGVALTGGAAGKLVDIDFGAPVAQGA